MPAAPVTAGGERRAARLRRRFEGAGRGLEAVGQPSESLSIESALLPLAASNPSLEPSRSESATVAFVPAFCSWRSLTPSESVSSVARPPNPGGADGVGHLGVPRPSRRPARGVGQSSRSVSIDTRSVARRRLARVPRARRRRSRTWSCPCRRAARTGRSDRPIGVGHRRRAPGIDRERVVRGPQGTPAAAPPPTSERARKLYGLTHCPLLPHLEVQVVRCARGVARCARTRRSPRR